MAADKLRVFRRNNSIYEILLYESDLKPHMSKEKKSELIKDLPEEDLVS
jgi:hypothetical protein